MSAMNKKKATSMNRLLPFAMTAAVLLVTAAAHAAAPGITGGATTPSFDLTAGTAFITQPDGQTVYSWGYGCNTQPAGAAPANIPLPSTGGCPTMQIPGPTL